MRTDGFGKRLCLGVFSEQVMAQASSSGGGCREQTGEGGILYYLSMSCVKQKESCQDSHPLRLWKDNKDILH